MIDDSLGFVKFKSRDGKVGPYDGSAGVVHFLTSLVMVPFLLLLVPISFVSRVFGGDKPVDLPPLKDAAEIKCTPPGEREFDLVVFGATGFTGELVCEHLAKNYGPELKWAIGGRRREALSKFREKVGKIHRNARNLPIVVADSKDEDSLVTMCSRTRVVASVVGPYALYGNDLVRVCASTGTHYADITGEAAWVRDMIEKYHMMARQTGAKIVHFTGHDSIPWDLSVMSLAEKIQNTNAEESLERVELYDDLNGSVSGGTIATVIHHLSNPSPRRSSLGFNPMDMELDGDKSPLKLQSEIKFGPAYSSINNTFYGFFFMSGVNKECVRRSNVLLKYGSEDVDLVYKEQEELPNVFAAFSWLVAMVLRGAVLASPLLRKVAFSVGALPQPGDGPSDTDMEAGYLLVSGYGFGSRGTKVASKLYIPKDPGYRFTAIMIAESALCMAIESSKLSNEGGIFTPAAALGSTLRTRLLHVGLEHQVFQVR